MVDAVRILACNVFVDDNRQAEQEVILYCEVFRLSNYTTFEILLRRACDYWGLTARDYGLYTIDDKEEAICL